MPVMAVMVQDDGTPILEYEIKEGQSIQFRVGGTVKAFMERSRPRTGRLICSWTQTAAT